MSTVRTLRSSGANHPSQSLIGLNPHLVPALLLILLTVLPAWAQAPPGEARPVPLSELMRPDWASRAPWNDGLSEIAEYQARIVADGAVREGRLVTVTGQEDFSRESLARAAWPYGARPIAEAIRQRMTRHPAGVGDTELTMVDLWADRRAPTRLLRLLVSRIQNQGALHRDFDYSGNMPTERFTSPRDGEGTGSRSIEAPQEALFEEQLPLVLRGLRLQDGATAWCALVTPVADGACQRPVSALAVLSITREKSFPKLPLRSWQGDAPWRIVIEAGDGRRIECLLAAEPAHTLLSLEHSNGSGFALSALRRGVLNE